MTCPEGQRGGRGGRHRLISSRRGNADADTPTPQVEMEGGGRGESQKVIAGGERIRGPNLRASRRSQGCERRKGRCESREVGEKGDERQIPSIDYPAADIPTATVSLHQTIWRLDLICKRILQSIHICSHPLHVSDPLPIPDWSVTTPLTPIFIYTRRRLLYEYAYLHARHV